MSTPTHHCRQLERLSARALCIAGSQTRLKWNVAHWETSKVVVIKMTFGSWVWSAMVVNGQVRLMPRDDTQIIAREGMHWS